MPGKKQRGTTGSATDVSAAGTPGKLELIALRGLPPVEPGDDLGVLIIEALQADHLELQQGDVIIVAQKVVSKAENCYAYLKTVEVSAQAEELAARTDKDPRQVQLVLQESREVLRVRPGVIIVEHRNGYVHANAGIDRSNIESDPDNPRVLLLPENPDQSAAQLREQIASATGVRPQVIINDSFGRAWRNGTVGVAIGCAGLQPLHNQVGERDLFGNVLEVTEPAVADELAAAASLLMGQAAEGCPVVLARGLDIASAESGSAALVRERSMDLFR
ncbi:MAG: coenzyme F420-0:L-glutamate ligase [Halioglobus sp.]